MALIVTNLTDKILQIPPSIKLMPNEVRTLYAPGSTDFLDKLVQEGKVSITDNSGSGSGGSTDITTLAKETTLAAGLGTDGNGAVLPFGTGIRGWLRGIYDRLNTVSRNTGVTDAGTQRVTLASDEPAVLALTSIDSKTPALSGGSVPVVIDQSNPGVTNKVSPTNFYKTFVDEFDGSTVDGSLWDTSTIGTNDIVKIEGNAAGASWLVISKDPLTANTVTIVKAKMDFDVPIETSVGLSMSQRTLGQELFMEVVSNDTMVSDYTPVAISSISQATTTLTVNTATNHNLVPGDAISIDGVIDSRFNYPSLVVATIPTPTQFTVTAGPGGALPSITAGPFVTGSVYKRQRLGRAKSGSSLVFENVTATNASMYIAADGGNLSPIGGTITGNHSITTQSTASVQAINAPYTYAFRATTEWKLLLTQERIQWHNVPIDSVAQTTSIQIATHLVPIPTKVYNFRFRAVNNRGLTVPVAKIVSMSKTGTTTATVTTDVPHGLTNTDLVTIYGSSDQTAYANLTAATAITVLNATQFTVVIGTAVTSTVYGGYVSRVNGGNLPSALGALTQVAVSATLATAADGKQVLTLTGNAAWTGILIGDFVNVLGLRSVPGVGSDLLCDGAWKVRNIVTTTLELEVADGRTPPANFGATVCGGGVIKRTDIRIPFVRLYEFDRQRVEIFSRPASDLANAIPVSVNNTIANITTVGTVSTVTTVTTVASVTAANLNIPGTIADVVSGALTTTTTTAALTPTFGISYEVNIPVTAVSGTTPTLDVGIEESDDTGTNWYRVYDFPRIIATGMYRSPKLPLKGNRVRYVQTVGGATPSFTRAINRLQSSDVPKNFVRQLIDRTIVPTTLNSVTPNLNVQECNNAQLIINLGAATTPPAIQLQGSDDNGISWYAIGSPLTGVASSSVQVTVNNIQTGLLRAIVSTAGATVTLGSVTIKGF